jgi:hypothetical protein
MEEVDPEWPLQDLAETSQEDPASATLDDSLTACAPKPDRSSRQGCLNSVKDAHTAASRLRALIEADPAAGLRAHLGGALGTERTC